MINHAKVQNMNKCLAILLLLLSTASMAQEKDRRAELNIEGRVKEISVSPSGAIWLVTAIGERYYTVNIDSTWHREKPFSAGTDGYDFDSPNLDRVSFFNSDTAIITGYISYRRSDMRKGGYYLSFNGGRTWKMLDFRGDSWIYNAFVDSSGHAWMGGSSGHIFYSRDFGQSWDTLNSPFNRGTRTNWVFMQDTMRGLGGALHALAFATYDNWHTYKKIPTPTEMGTYTAEHAYDGRVNKLIYWKQYYVIDQDGHIFYSDTSDLNWKKFPLTLIDFEPDAKAEYIYAVDDKYRVVRFASPDEFIELGGRPLPSRPIDLQMLGSSLYIFTNDYQVCMVNENGMKCSIPYTTDEMISDPYIVREGSQLSWGANANQLYISDGKEHDWYRENVLDFSVYDLFLLDDSTAIMWDGFKNNYKYTLGQHKAEPYQPVEPLKDFLASPIKAFSIDAGSRGCFHFYRSCLNYWRENDSVFSCNGVSKEEFSKEETSNFRRKIGAGRLLQALRDINAAPSAVPSLRDFKINDKDIDNYQDMLAKLIKERKEDVLDIKPKIDKDFYMKVPEMLDSLPPELISKLFDEREGVESTTSNWFVMILVNMAGDTLMFTHYYYVNSLPWHLPWQVSYKGLNFSSCSLGLSRFILDCLPDNFTDRDLFDNKHLIILIADHLNSERQ